MEQKLVRFLRSKKTLTSAKRSSLLLLSTKNVLNWAALMVSECLAHLWDFFTIANVNSTAIVVLTRINDNHESLFGKKKNQNRHITFSKTIYMFKYPEVTLGMILSTKGLKKNL